MNGTAVTRELVPPGSWDCHIHCFDPQRFPFRPDRAYTPFPAPLESFASWSRVENVMVVQATIEDNEDGILTHLKEARQKWPDKTFYGTVVSTLEPRGENVLFDAEKTKHMHAAGIRCVRVHAGFNADVVNSQIIWQHLLEVATSLSVTRHGWAISMQLPLHVWASLQDLLGNSSPLDGVNVIADHLGCATPSNTTEPAFETFLDMLGQRKLYVKISALHRRSPRNIHDMKGTVQRMADAAPDRLLWGSDWPHVNSSIKTKESTPPLGVDALEELVLIKSWLTEAQWQQMMVDNPRRVFRTA